MNSLIAIQAPIVVSKKLSGNVKSNKFGFDKFMFTIPIQNRRKNIAQVIVPEIKIVLVLCPYVFKQSHEINTILAVNIVSQTPQIENTNQSIGATFGITAKSLRIVGITITK